MRRILLYMGIGLVILGGFLAFFLQYIYNASRELTEQIYDPLPIGHVAAEQTPGVEVSYAQSINEKEQEEGKDGQAAKNQSITILIIGVDRRSGDEGRSDVLMLVAINPNDPSTRMMNIPRDTITTIWGMDGASKEDKVNHAYAYGGTAMTVATVEHLVGIPIDYYMKVDMEGFQEIIDIIGGVEVRNPFAFQYEGHDFAAGLLTLNGDEALAFVRMRYEDPQGDLGRNERQRLVVKAIVNKLLHIKNLLKLNKMIAAIEKHVRTNLTFEQWTSMSVSVDYRAAFAHTEIENYEGYGQIIDGIYYYMITDEEKHRITEKLLAHLDR